MNIIFHFFLKLIFLYIFIIIIFFYQINVSHSQTSSRTTVKGSGEPVPRFVSLKTDKANLRKGPSPDHPIDWEYNAKGLPFKVLAENNVGGIIWLKVIDSKGTLGWMHRRLLSSKRTVEVVDNMLILRHHPKKDSEIKAKAEIGAILNIRRCEKNWCRLSSGKISGWAPRKGYFGLLKNEIEIP